MAASRFVVGGQTLKAAAQADIASESVGSH